jgi:hypothetical protein
MAKPALSFSDRLAIASGLGLFAVLVCVMLVLQYKYGEAAFFSRVVATLAGCI